MTALSVCMIARDEEGFLPACLESVRGIAREVVLVDTGSTDRTVEIARAAGAKVLAFEWCDDFAAARNVGIEVARGSHVLVLDADERLGPGAAEGLARAMQDAELLLGSLPLHNASTLGASELEVVTGARRIGEPVWVPRLFPNRPEMRYRRRVHETLAEGFNALHARGLGRTKAVAAPLIHFGDVPSLRAGLGKDDRNERLLRRALAEDPRDGEVAGYLVVQLLKQLRIADAREVGESALAGFLAAIDARPAGHLPANTVRLGYALSFAQAETGALEAALSTARECAARSPDAHPNLEFAAAHALERLGRRDEARDAYARCLALHGRAYAQPVLPGLTSDLAQLRLAELALADGDAAESLRRLESVGGAWTVKGALLAAEAELARGDAAAAMARLAPLADLATLPPDFHALAYRALTELGEAAEELYAAATGAPAERWIEPRRRPAPLGRA